MVNFFSYDTNFREDSSAPFFFLSTKRNVICWPSWRLLQLDANNDITIILMMIVEMIKHKKEGKQVKEDKPDDDLFLFAVIFSFQIFFYIYL